MSAQNPSEMITSALGLSHQPSKGERLISLVMQIFLYGIIFLAGYIFAKIQTLVSGL